MTPERWRRVTAAFHAALKRKPDSRGAFLDQACGADTDERADVERLLAAHDDAGQFGAAPLPVFLTAPSSDAGADRSADDLSVSADLPAEPRRRHSFLPGVWLATAFVLVNFTYAAWLLVGAGEAPSLGWVAAPGGDRWYVAGVQPSGPAAELLRRGDRIVTVNGAEPLGDAGIYYERRSLSVGDSYALVVERGGERHEYRLVMGRTSYTANEYLFFLVSLVWCAVGLFIGFARPATTLSRLAFAAAIATGLVFLQVSVIRSGYLWQPLHIVLGFHFFLRFPTDRPPTGIWKWALALMYGAVGIHAVPRMVAHGMVLSVGPAAAREVVERFGMLFDWGLRLVTPAYLAAVIAMVVVLPLNYRSLNAEDMRRRVRWVVYGSAVGLVLQIWWAAVRSYERFVGPVQVPSFTMLANALTIAIPLTVAYAVIRHRVLDIKVVVRRGLQYLLARRVLQAAVAVPISALIYVVISHRDLTIAELVGDTKAYLFWLGAASLALAFRVRLGHALERRFFRGEYDSEQLLLGLLEEIRKVDSSSELARVVSDRLTLTLHPASASLWYRDADAFAATSPATAPDFPPTPPGDRWLAWTESQGQATALPLPPDAGLSRRESRWFSDRGISLIVPLMDSTDRLVGALFLGDKKSDEPYTASDSRLLSAIARQAADVREKLRLRERVSEEARVKHDVLARLDRRFPDLLKECPDCGACYDGAVDRCLTDGQLLALSLPVARTIDNKYRLDRLIGRGGMGAVYEAHDLRLDRSVAVKILLGRAFGKQAALRRFRREAQATARLNHPNIVALYDYGTLEGEGAYLVMERVNGVTLREELQRRKASLPLSIAAEWFDPLLDGIAAAHAAGIIHRDLKPENVMGGRTASGKLIVKILDLGLAKFQTSDPPGSSSVTVQGLVMGTPDYMSPEQFTGGAVDQRADIFALGVMLLEVLTHHTFDPAADRRRPKVPVNWSGELIAPLAQVRPLESVIQRCLAGNPRARFQSAGALRDELIPLLRAAPPLEAAGEGILQ